MAKTRKLKKNVAVILGIIAFFIVYLIFFKIGTTLDKKTDGVSTKIQEEVEDTRPLLTQLKEKDKIYLSDKNVKNIKIEEDNWNEIKYFLSDLRKIRKVEGYKSVYEGYTDDGIKFSTDFNFFRIYTVDKEEYYKVPVSSKDSLKKILTDSMYTSFEFLKQYKTWESATVSYKGEVKKIKKWKYDDLSYKMISKRTVGKVQPEKSKERSKYNFVIDLVGENYNAKVEVMGEDYIKIIAKDSIAYYEVHDTLFYYLKDEVFKIN